MTVENSKNDLMATLVKLALIISLAIMSFAVFACVPEYAYAADASNAPNADAGKDYANNFINGSDSNNLRWNEQILSDSTGIGKDANDTSASNMTEKMWDGLKSFTALACGVVIALFVLRIVLRALWEMSLASSGGKSITGDTMPKFIQFKASASANSRGAQGEDEWLKTAILDFAKYMGIVLGVCLIIGIIFLFITAFFANTTG